MLRVSIQLSSVHRRTFRFSVVWATIMALTSSRVVCGRKVTGLTLLPCLMSARWPRNCSLKVLPDCPTYCIPHLLQLMTYITFLVLQLNWPLI